MVIHLERMVDTITVEADITLRIFVAGKVPKTLRLPLPIFFVFMGNCSKETLDIRVAADVIMLPPKMTYLNYKFEKKLCVNEVIRMSGRGASFHFLIHLFFQFSYSR